MLIEVWLVEFVEDEYHTPSLLAVFADRDFAGRYARQHELYNPEWELWLHNDHETTWGCSALYERGVLSTGIRVRRERVQ